MAHSDRLIGSSFGGSFVLAGCACRAISRIKSHKKLCEQRFRPRTHRSRLPGTLQAIPRTLKYHFLAHDLKWQHRQMLFALNSPLEKFFNFHISSACSSTSLPANDQKARLARSRNWSKALLPHFTSASFPCECDFVVQCI